jgi:radical SAM-linked protein
MSFGPALALGIASVGEYIDVKLIDPPEAEELVRRLNEVAARGVEFLGAAHLGDADPGLSKIVDEARYVFGVATKVLQERAPASDAEATLGAMIQAFHDNSEAIVERDAKGIKRKIDVKAGVIELRLGGADEYSALDRAGVVGSLATFSVCVPLSSDGAVRPREIVEALGGKDLPFVALRLGLMAKGTSPLELSAHKKAAVVPKAAVEQPALNL